MGFQGRTVWVDGYQPLGEMVFSSISSAFSSSALFP
jgi:hypothetical protein